MKSNILVTGSHRSGTTWTARVMSARPGVNYIAEPFNPGFDFPNNPAGHWFHYLNPDNEYPEFRKYLESRLYPTAYGFLNESGDIFRRGYTGAYFRSQWRKIFCRWNAMKDPIAVFSAPWLAKNFNMRVIVLIRHPAAFVSSLRIKGWNFDFNELLRQEELMQNLLLPFRLQIEKFAVDKYSITEQGILLWNVIYYAVNEYRKSYPGWLFIRHEDISVNPGMVFRKIFDYAGIDWSPEVEKKIVETTSGEPSGTVESSMNDSIVRSSARNIWTWKSRLSDTDIRQVKDGTYQVWKKFYHEDEW